MGTTRPKGFITVTDKRTSDPNEWKPTPEALRLIGQVREVLAASRLGGAKSVRFIFYRLVGNYGYPKTEKDYKNLGEVLVKARRAQLISFNAISDSGTTRVGGSWGYRKRSDFLEGLKEITDEYRLDPLLTQPFHIELWSEDAGSVDMLASIVSSYPVTVYSTGGFSSVTVTHEVAQRVLKRKKPTIFLHVGDYDPSGESIYKSMSQDIGAFVSDYNGGTWNPNTGETFMNEDNKGFDFRPVRVALTEDQVEMWDLETAPPKATDSRSNNWIGETTQVQAMSEDQMEETVLAAVRDYIDQDAMDRLEEREQEEKDEMRPLIEEAMDNVITELDGTED